jgi:hypothetical protein
VVLRDQEDCDSGSDYNTAALAAHLENLAVCEQDPAFRFFEKLNCGACGGDRVEGLNNELAGYVPRFVPTHPIGNSPKARIVSHQTRILVSRPDVARMGGGTCIKCEKWLVH